MGDSRYAELFDQLLSGRTIVDCGEPHQPGNHDAIASFLQTGIDGHWNKDGLRYTINGATLIWPDGLISQFNKKNDREFSMPGEGVPYVGKLVAFESIVWCNGSIWTRARAGAPRPRLGDVVRIVRVINANNRSSLGKIGRLIACDGLEGYPYEIGGIDGSYRYAETELEVLEVPNLNVGDRFKVVFAFSSSDAMRIAVHVGDTGAVIELSTSGDACVKLDRYPLSSHWVPSTKLYCLKKLSAISMYLPMRLKDVPVLIPQSDYDFLVDNSELDARSGGLGYRTEMDVESKDPIQLAAWGSHVRGVRVSDEWVKVEVKPREIWRPCIRCKGSGKDNIGLSCFDCHGRGGTGDRPLDLASEIDDEPNIETSHGDSKDCSLQ